MRSTSRLFATFAAASLVPVVALGALVVQDYRRDAAEQGRAQGLAQADVIAQMVVAPALNSGEAHILGGDLSRRGLTAEQYERMRESTGLAVYRGSVQHLRLRGFTGRVIFSDDGSSSNGVPVSDPDFQAAAAGAARAKVIIGRTQTIRVMQPLFAGATGQSVGVLEVYLPYQSIADRLDHQVTQTVRRIGGGLAALYLVLALLAWWITRSLRRYAADQRHNALHDALTGLPNRVAFRAEADAVLNQARRDGETGAVVLVDLNRFKEVNDTLGHHAGDELLRVVSERFRAGLDSRDLLARLGGDEFALLLPGRTGPEAVALLEGVRDRLAEEMVLDGVPLSIEASFGIALYPEHGDHLQELTQHADVAMYQGKRGTADIVIYSGTGVAHSHQWLVVQAELRHALERDELVLHYQPKVNLPDGAVIALEALVRWEHPERGLLPPGVFLPAAEHSGLIVPLTEWVLRRALTDQLGWTAAGQSWAVSVNVSVRNLEVAGFPDLVAALLAETGTPPERLVLEVTETALAGDVERVERVLAQVAALGVGLSVDDFGAGFTSLSHLRGQPVAEIKIDRKFVADVTHDPQSRAIVRSVIELAHGLGSRVTAEGVETAEVYRWLIDAGCDEAQGYLIGRPVPWPQVDAGIFGLPGEMSEATMIEGMSR
ncbi:putative bifunctional diguanylate cyclase/phosphodiesterase [Actinoplanes philippinensis]|uniref:putative bifunctional diguanylate cyclase/phosphodiesterase n=1 Tax=Actinoplanes philippinensis TaxID=35752 RepID=UPI001EF3AB01|nr:bifunctional diguanylate cyclase/phosphodiesterase [Actinoplanes philippinensis]